MSSSPKTGPTIAIMGLEDRLSEQDPRRIVVDDDTEPKEPGEEVEDVGELDLEGIDDDEIDSYIVSEKEASSKEGIWMKINAEYLKEQKEKEERLAKEREEGKPEKKKRKVSRKPRNNYLANSAGEAIEKMLQEKKISSKINYEVLRSLTDMPLSVKQSSDSAEVSEYSVQVEKESTESAFSLESATEASQSKGRKKNVRFGKYLVKKEPVKVELKEIKTSVSPIKEKEIITEETLKAPPEKKSTEAVVKDAGVVQVDDQDDVEELEEEEDDDHEHNEMSVAQLLSQHRGEDEYYNEYDDDDYA